MDFLSTEWEVEVVSWLDPTALGMKAAIRQLTLASLPRLAVGLATLPMPVAYTRALAPRKRLAEATRRFDLVLYVTDRAVPAKRPRRFVIDFVDDLAGAAARKAAASKGMRKRFWRWQCHLTRRLDRTVSEEAAFGVAVSEQDARTIGPKVICIPLPVPLGRPRPGDGNAGRQVVFTGNLFFGPNLEASLWICEELVPALVRRGVAASQVTIAGRRPGAALTNKARQSGIQLLPDVANMGDVLNESAVVIAPMLFGSGVKNKVLEAVAAGKPCVLTPDANEGIGLVDGVSGLVRERESESFAEAVLHLLENPELGGRLAEAAAAQLVEFSPEKVAALWREKLRPLRPDSVAGAVAGE